MERLIWPRPAYARPRASCSAGRARLDAGTGAAVDRLLAEPDGFGVAPGLGREMGEHLEQPALGPPVADPASVVEGAPHIVGGGLVAHPGGQLEVEEARVGDPRADVATAEILERDTQLVGQIGHDGYGGHALAALDARQVSGGAAGAGDLAERQSELLAQVADPAAGGDRIVDVEGGTPDAAPRHGSPCRRGSPSAPRHRHRARPPDPRAARRRSPSGRRPARS